MATRVMRRVRAFFQGRPAYTPLLRRAKRPCWRGYPFLRPRPSLLPSTVGSHLSGFASGGPPATAAPGVAPASRPALTATLASLRRDGTGESFGIRPGLQEPEREPTGTSTGSVCGSDHMTSARQTCHGHDQSAPGRPLLRCAETALLPASEPRAVDSGTPSDCAFQQRRGGFDVQTDRTSRCGHWRCSQPCCGGAASLRRTAAGCELRRRAFSVRGAVRNTR